MPGVGLVVINIILSLISIIVIIYAFISGKRLHSFVMKALIVSVLLSTCVAQENDSFVGDTRPLVLPDGFLKGTKVIESDMKEIIDYFTEDDLWRQSVYEFLYGDASVGANANLTNNTNLTA